MVDRCLHIDIDERTEARSRQRARLALELIDRHGCSSRGRLLDAGCGPGYATRFFRENGFEVLGLDILPEAVSRARAIGCEARVLDLVNEPIPGGFDVVVALEVLEHLGDPVRVLGKLADAVRPGGNLVVSLPNEFHLIRRIGILLGRGLGGHRSRHRHVFDRRSARELFRETGMTVRAERAVSVVPPRMKTLSFLSRPLVRLDPGLFAIAHMFLLDTGAGRRGR